MKPKTAEEAGWSYSPYNLFVPVPGSDLVAWINTLRSTCAEFSAKEYELIRAVLTFPENHPLVKRYAERGILTDHDEREELRNLYIQNTDFSKNVVMTICPTMACNFDCPYCFEKHIPGMMTQKVQDDIVQLAEKMMDESDAETVHIRWFGGEPLLGLQIIESLSERLQKAALARGAEYEAEIITNGYLLDAHAAAVLEQAKVNRVQITLDGMQEAHDRTRHLSNGGGTFDRIIENLRRKLPFHVLIRHNVTAENEAEEETLRRFIEAVAEETGNDLVFYSAAVFDSDAAKERGSGVQLLCDDEGEEMAFDRMARDFGESPIILCDGCRRYSVTADHCGRLYICCEKAGDPEECYGTADTFDPVNPVATSSNPELTAFYRDTDRLFRTECGECVFLPQCHGCCAAARRRGKHRCPSFRNDPDGYVLGIYRWLKAHQPGCGEE